MFKVLAVKEAFVTGTQERHILTCTVTCTLFPAHPYHNRYT